MKTARVKADNVQQMLVGNDQMAQEVAQFQQLQDDVLEADASFFIKSEEDNYNQ